MPQLGALKPSSDFQSLEQCDGIVPTIKKLTENRVHPSSRQRGWGTRAAIYAIVSRDGGVSTEAPQAETSSFRARGRDRPAASTFRTIL